MAYFQVRAVSFREGNLRVEVFSGNVRFPPALPNIAGKNGPGMKMYFGNEKKIRLAMLVYQRVHISGWLHICGCYFTNWLPRNNLCTSWHTPKFWVFLSWRKQGKLWVKLRVFNHFSCCSLDLLGSKRHLQIRMKTKQRGEYETFTFQIMELHSKSWSWIYPPPCECVESKPIFFF